MMNKQKQKEYLNKYVNGDLNLTPFSNIVLNNRDTNWYSEIGKYVREIFNDKLEGTLSFFNGEIQKKPTLIQRFGDRKLNDINTSIGIFFLTSELSRENLEKIFGKPLIHKKFGEGGIKGGTYASYFVRINDRLVHIGYDHRGTNIEVEFEGTIDDVFDFTEDQCREYFEIIKVLADKYRSLF